MISTATGVCACVLVPARTRTHSCRVHALADQFCFTVPVGFTIPPTNHKKNCQRTKRKTKPVHSDVRVTP
uniref:Putative secreted protein n=1 Tax=Anopheles triannulatus TaxID=58253 RepID=A0A2M4B7M1_9DIPT